MQGPMLLASSLDLEHKQGRSEAVQLIALAAELRQGRAHVGNWSTRLEISVVVLLEAVAVVEVVTLLLALCAKTGPMRRADELRKVLKCILGGLMVGVSMYSRGIQSSPCDLRDWKWQRLQFKDRRKTGEKAASERIAEGIAVDRKFKSVEVSLPSESSEMSITG